LTAEIPVELMQLPARLHGLFDAHLPAAASGTPDEREKNFLSRAIAAYAIHKLAGASIAEASASVVDGGGDGGIDAIYYAAAGEKLWIVQSKFVSNGRGEPNLGDVTKFKAGLEYLLSGKFDAFDGNPAIKAMLPALAVHFANKALQVRPVLAYSGIHLISEDRKLLFEDLKRKFSRDDDYLDILVCNLTTIHDWLTGSDHGPGVDVVELTLLEPGWLKAPYETIYGLIPLDELANLHALHGKKLIAANIRGFKGRTDVNDEIVKAVEEEAGNFFYLNNGLTAYCERLEVNNLDRADSAKKRLVARGFSIVNGAQTLGSVAKVFAGAPNQLPKGHVFLRIISLEKCANNIEFAERITRSTNFQNPIGLREFAAQYEQQDIIAKHLVLSDIYYHYKPDDDTPMSDAANFTLEEATTACACLAKGGDCDFLTRVLANRSSLWSLEKVYPEDELLRSRCERVFPPDRSARAVWRAVQAQRIVLSVTRAAARAETGARKAFFENCRWLVLHILLLRLRPENGNELALSANEIAAVSTAAGELAEALFSECAAKGFVTSSVDPASGLTVFQAPRHFRTVFSAPGDCQLLRQSMLAKLAAQDVAAAAQTDGSLV